MSLSCAFQSNDVSGAHESSVALLESENVLFNTGFNPDGSIFQIRNESLLLATKSGLSPTVSGIHITFVAGYLCSISP